MLLIFAVAFVATFIVLLVFVATGGELPPLPPSGWKPKEPDYEPDDPDGIDRWNDEGGWK